MNGDVTLAAPVAVPVLAQFSYASADRGAGSGGWQVLQRTEGVEPLLDELVRYTPSSIESLVAIQDYPVPGMARRLMMTSVDGGARLAGWHSVPAGRDGSGRPGNVFTHGVVLAEASARPAQLWDFPGWLQPYGPREVNAATLPATVAFECAEMLAPLAEFLFNPMHWRIGTLAVLVDAVHAALAGGPRVILLVDDHEEAARWIQAVQACTDARSAHRIHFSTFERRGADQLEPLDLHIVGLPRVDREAVEKRTGVVVIDGSALPELGQLGGPPHQTARGDQIDVTSWSALLLERCATSEDLTAMVHGLDAVRAALPDAEWIDPAWPLALVAFEEGGGGNRDAAMVLARSTPPEVTGHPGHYQAVAAALDLVLGDSAAEQWHGLQNLNAHGGTELMLGLASANFAARAIADPDWLGAAEPAPHVDDRLRPQASEPGRDAARSGLDSLVAGAMDEIRVRAAMRCCDLIDALGWDEIPVVAGGLESVAEWIAEGLRQWGGWVADDLRRARPGTVARIRGVVLSLAARPSAAAEVPWRVIDALGMTSLEFLAGPDVWMDRGVEVAPLAVRAAREVLTSSGAYSDDVRRQALFLDAYAKLTDRDTRPAGIYRDEPSGDPSRDGRGAAAVVLSSRQVVELLDRFRARVPAHLVNPVLVTVDETALPGLADSLRFAGHGSAEFADLLIQLGAGRPPTDAVGHSLATLESGLASGGPLPVRLAEAAEAMAVVSALTERGQSYDKRPSFLASTSFVSSPVPQSTVDSIAVGMANGMPDEWVQDGRGARWILSCAATYSLGSPIQSIRRNWVAQCGGDDPLVARILVAIARERGVVVTSDQIERTAAQLTARLEPGDPRIRSITRFLDQWTKRYGLAAQRGAGEWIMRVSGRRRPQNGVHSRDQEEN